MIDWHSHILPGVDDGAADMEESVAMASALAGAGFGTVYCTPHLKRGCYEAGNDQIRRGVTELQQRLDYNDISLKLLPGREYCLDEYLLESLEDPLPLGTTRLILVEFLPQVSADMIRQLLYGVVKKGFTPVIAHPERCSLLEPVVPAGNGGFIGSIKSLLKGSNHERSGNNDAPDSTGSPLLDYLRDLGCCFQGNIGSFAGFYGRQIKNSADKMLGIGLYDRYGSDLHAPEHAGTILKGLRQLS